MKAFVLVNVHAGKSPEVVSKLRQVKGVTTAHACWGRPDIFAIVEAPSEKAFADTVLEKIQEVLS